MDIQRLIQIASEAREKAVAPYSGFKVGAALFCGDQRIYKGCNIEVSSYGLTMCAERVALFKALSDGAGDFKVLAIVADADPVCYPCGACRQVIWDFAPDARIICANLKGHYELFDPRDLLPKAFGPANLNR